MTVAAPQRPSPPVSTIGRLPLEVAADLIRLYRFNVAQYEKLLNIGVLPEDGSHELLGGLIVHKDRSVLGEDPMGHSPLHRKAVRLLTKLASRIDGPTRHLQIQSPISIPSDGEPEPDAAVILGADDAYTDRLPEAREV